ncbi:MAG: hypothetical protein HYT16_02245 [DPANN group archaeon]|nr:hypothetical protein [DPANN group archaeon]
MDRRKLAVLALFSALIITFTFLSTRVTFHDTHEYITVAKEMAGIHNVNVHSGHSFVYPAYISFFVKIFPSMYAIKLANVVWIIAIVAMLAFSSKSFKPLLIFITSPLVWWLSPQITPVLPAAFFFTLAYLSIKKFERRQSTIWLAVCGTSLGTSFSFYDLPMFLLIGAFIILFFYEKQFKHFLALSTFLFLGIMPRLLLDYYLFHNPVYSIIRFIGSNISISQGLANKMPALANMFNIGYVAAIFVAVTPLLILSYKTDWKKYLREGLLFLLLFLFFWWRAAPVDGLLQSAGRGVKYFMLFAPILFLVLSTRINKKQILLGAIASVFIIMASVSGYFIEFNKVGGGFNFFGENRDSQIAQDIYWISEDGYQKVVASGAGTFYAAQLFAQKPFIFWWKEYDAAISNKAAYSKINYNTKYSKLHLLEQLELQATLNTKPNDFSDAEFVFEKGDEIPAGFELEKCYTILCIYKNTKEQND